MDYNGTNMVYRFFLRTYRRNLEHEILLKKVQYYTRFRRNEGYDLHIMYSFYVLYKQTIKSKLNVVPNHYIPNFGASQCVQVEALVLLKHENRSTGLPVSEHFTFLALQKERERPRYVCTPFIRNCDRSTLSVSTKSRANTMAHIWSLFSRKRGDNNVINNMEWVNNFHLLKAVSTTCESQV
jgi:hypothetical protein